jgi:hypothetical protein
MKDAAGSDGADMASAAESAAFREETEDVSCVPLAAPHAVLHVKRPPASAVALSARARSRDKASRSATRALRAVRRALMEKRSNGPA